jgi:hypothetical protein
MSKSSEPIDIAGEIRHETDAAYLFFDGDIEVWLPKAHCEWDPDAKTMAVAEWLAMDRGLI